MKLWHKSFLSHWQISFSFHAPLPAHTVHMQGSAAICMCKWHLWRSEDFGARPVGQHLGFGSHPSLTWVLGDPITSGKFCVDQLTPWTCLYVSSIHSTPDLKTFGMWAESNLFSSKWNQTALFVCTPSTRISPFVVSPSSLHFNMMPLAREYVLLHTSMWSFNVDHDTFDYGHMRLRPPLNSVWAIWSRCVLSVSSLHSHLYLELSTGDHII